MADGLRVLELGSGLSGAIAALILADNGADVIKVEPPGGDPLRAHPAFRMWQRGKQALRRGSRGGARSRTCRGARGGGGRRALELTPGVDARFGLDPAAIMARNPQAIVCRITGFGPQGPYAHYPAWDGIVAAKAGRMLEFCGLVGGARPAYAAVPVAGWSASQLALARDPRGAARSRAHGPRAPGRDESGAGARASTTS